jgi:cobalt-zinc-cadmium efflux system outer membrane protein
VRALLFLVVLAAASPLPAPVKAQAAATQAPQSLTLARLEQLALENNPTARAAQAVIDAARGRARQASAWPNPTAGYAGEEIPLRGSSDARGEHGFFVEQTIPLGGKLSLGRAVFERAADEGTARAELQRQRIVSSVRALFYQVLTTERRIEVHERLAALGSEATGVTAQLFNVGAADRPDFLESEIETRRVQLELNAARNQAFAVRQQLAAVVGVPDAATRPLAGSIDQALPELERDTTLQALIERSPQVQAARAAIARAQAQTALARRETYPDVFLRGGAAYNRERGEETRRPVGWEGQIEAGISIPLFNRNQGGTAAARAEETVAQAELTRLQLALRAQAASEFATYLTAIRSAESFRADILPRAEQAYTLYLARYREMSAAYPQVLVAQRGLFEMAREYLNHLEDAWRSALRLQGLLAGDGLEALDGDAQTIEASIRTGRE